ncbi:MAG TPA: TadG family pilus assembly protein [Planctomycetaceae bacterium]|nr:TadG family pilus assembly protein [Planctomycetaceae bacterium]
MLRVSRFIAVRRTARRAERRRGAVLVLAAVVMIVVFAFTAFTVDVGYIALVRTQLQCAADSTALAAALHVGSDADAAKSDAVSAGAANLAAGNPVLLQPDSDLEFGRWDEGTGTFVPLADGGDPSANAVRATCRLNQARGSSVKLFFAPVLGINETDLTASAITMVERTLCGPLVGIESISLTGNPRTDSYRSDEGPYNALTARSNGSVCSDGPIQVIGSAEVNGNANPGRGFETTLVGSATVTGSTTPRTRPLNLPPVDPGDAEFVNDNEHIPDLPSHGNSPPSSPVDADGNLTLDGNVTLELPPGTYYLNDLTLTGQATLSISGPTLIYLTGSLDTAGGRMANDTQIPGDLKILMTGGTARIIGNTDFHAVVYAPHTDVTITGTGSLYGAVVARNLIQEGNGSMHYDENLDLAPEIMLPARPVLVQ